MWPKSLEKIRLGFQMWTTRRPFSSIFLQNALRHTGLDENRFLFFFLSRALYNETGVKKQNPPKSTEMQNLISENM